MTGRQYAFGDAAATGGGRMNSVKKGAAINERELREAYEKIVAMVVEAESICVLTTTPFVDMDTVEVDPSIERHNAVVRAVAKATPAHLVDLYAVTKAGHKGGTRTLIQNANGADNWGDSTPLLQSLLTKAFVDAWKLPAQVAEESH